MTRLSRRALLISAGSLAGAGAVAGAVAKSRRRRPGAPPPRPSAAPPASGATAATPAHTPLPRGGRLSIAAPASFDFDTFDAARSGEPSVVELLGRAHARLIQWADPAAAVLGPDLAAAWEQPDPLTLVLRLDPRARWHDVPPLAGRPVTAAEVQAHLARVIAIARAGDAPRAHRSAALLDVARVETPGPAAVRLALDRPSPLLLPALAGEFALVQPPDVLEGPSAPSDPLDPSLLAGCGPWVFAGFDGPAARFRAHASGHRSPLLDELAISPPLNVLERYRAGELDEFPAIDPRDAAAARALPGIQELPRYHRELVLSTFTIAGPPWSDPRLVEAVSAALNRGWLTQALFAGRASPSGPLPPCCTAALQPSGLAPFPGYAADPAADARAARERWEAAGGPSLGTVTVDIPSIFDPRYAASAIVITRLNDVLGPQFRPAIETYTTIARRVQEGAYGNGRAAFWFGWSPPLPSPDPRELLLHLYGHALALAERSNLLAADPADSAAFAGLQQAILRGGFRGVVPWVQQVGETFRRPGTVGPVPSPFWDGYRDVQRYRLP
ncbi:ABC transporter substrate-binding protein [Tepidiforma thermophila]|uniref:ABC-type transport system substrate-binding protein n=1 Tax=Tepidiforma thermophila (strain KCTC 52669 / CGMCC 1.13589 / G233) TaxID=2761530 RepID=A0A2A9HH03_TEPT2|nr:ABC transporter substrate-binding protein [Tepidiforma thermophila]PFG74099.1 ABC-type transport system substrate-binding protein [Tepidiforma thermophila]